MLLSRIKIFMILAGAAAVTLICVGISVYKTYFWQSPTANTIRDITQPATSQEADFAEAPSEPLTTFENLTIPWELVFLPDESWLITERPGNVIRAYPDTGETTRIQVPDVAHVGEGGLLGAAVHPETFTESGHVYLYHTSEDADRGYVNRIIRYTLTNDELRNPFVILDNIPGSRFHDGGRMIFGPDSCLYATTGDATNSGYAQDTKSLAGKILRLNVLDDRAGDCEDNNPFGNEVYSYGHRNPQGLAFFQNELISTEHGRSGIRSGFDEINHIRRGGNFGWPSSQGDEIAGGTIAPLAHSGPNTTWAPGGAAVVDDTLVFVGLRGAAVYSAQIQRSTDGEITLGEITEHFTGEFGRIRTVVHDGDGALYVLTSNRDGRGDPTATDDRIIRIPTNLLIE